MDKEEDTITIDSEFLINIPEHSSASGSYTINTNMNSKSYTYSSTTPYIYTTNNTSGAWGNGGIGPTHNIHVKGDADFDGDVKIKGINIAKSLEDIQKRLAILVPDPAKLAHFEALKKAYNHYKTLEALCELPKEETNE